MSNKTQTAVEWLIEHVKSTEWQDMYIWHKEEMFQQAKAMHNQQQDLLNECEIQLEYLNQKFGETGTTNALLAKLKNK